MMKSAKSQRKSRTIKNMYFGAHLETRAGESGVVFRVWAPHAAAISVVGDFNSWKPGSHPMRKVDGILSGSCSFPA